MPTQNKHPSHTRCAGQIKPPAYKLTKDQQFPNTSTYKLENSQTHKLTNASTQELKILNYYFFILQIHSNFHSLLAKNARLYA